MVTEKAGARQQGKVLTEAELKEYLECDVIGSLNSIIENTRDLIETIETEILPNAKT